jgi:hypothetical protein
MAGALTDEQVAAALADMIYQRGLADRTVDIASSGGNIPGGEGVNERGAVAWLDPVDNFLRQRQHRLVGRGIRQRPMQARSAGAHTIACCIQAEFLA